MAQQYVTGPAHIFVGVGPAGAPLYLGTAERWPKISIRPNYEPTFNDLGGKVPFDVSYQGEEGFVSADISRWNEPVYALLASRPRPNTTMGAGPVFAVPRRGINVFGDVGTLLIAERMAYTLTVTFPYVTKGIFVGMPAGYRFLAAYLIGPDELEPLGTTPRKIRLLWHGLRIFNPSSQTLSLYDHVTAGLPPVD